jgi:hypothetical protein
MDKKLWAPLVDCFVDATSRADFLGRRLDVRENVRFTGGYLARWVHATYPETGCALALEWKKLYMDEWTGRADPRAVCDVARVMSEATAALRAWLRKIPWSKRR